MQLDHINISAPFELLVEVRRFYCDVIGLVEGDRPAFSRRGFWLYAADVAVLHLIESDDHFAYERKGYLDHVAFNRSDVTGFVASLQKHGVEYDTAYIDSLDLTQVFLFDPSGIKLEFNFANERL